MAQSKTRGSGPARRTSPARLFVVLRRVAVGAILAFAGMIVPVRGAPDALSGATLEVSAGSEDARPVLTVALLDTLINPYDSFELQQTTAHLSASLSNWRVRVMTIAAAEAEAAIKQYSPDFLIAPSGFVAGSAIPGGISGFRIATRKSVDANRADESVGAAFVVRKADGLMTLADLKGRRAAASLPTAVEGWLAAAGEIQSAGYDPEKFFASVAFRNNAYPDVVAALLSGSIDVAILPSCLFETLEKDGLVDMAGLTVAAEKSGGLACRHSSALYPDVSLLALPWAPEQAVRDVTIAILSDKSEAGFEWMTNVSMAGVQALLRRLETGPYAYLRDMSPAGLFARWRTELLSVAALILFLLAHECAASSLGRQGRSGRRGAPSPGRAHRL